MIPSDIVFFIERKRLRISVSNKDEIEEVVNMDLKAQIINNMNKKDLKELLTLYDEFFNLELLKG